MIQLQKVARTGDIGGQIRHNDINSYATIQEQGGEKNDDN
jgi:hypothetical protein